jgi:hypothetical protein
MFCPPPPSAHKRHNYLLVYGVELQVRIIRKGLIASIYSRRRLLYKSIKPLLKSIILGDEVDPHNPGPTAGSGV